MNKHVIAMTLVALTASGCCAHRGGRCGPMGGDQGTVPPAEEGRELRDIHFAFDSSALDTTAKDSLRTNANWLNANANREVQIEGHCDERGTNEYNLALGERRARAAYDYLRSLGVRPQRMSTISYGEDVPLDPGHNESAWSKNRRDHFRLK